MSEKTTARRAGSKVKWVALALVAVLLGGGAVSMARRGPSGATAAMGGSIPAKPAPELPAEANRWVNGDPVSLAAARGQVLLVEAWHPA
jgi:hypothetical protein